MTRQLKLGKHMIGEREIRPVFEQLNRLNTARDGKVFRAFRFSGLTALKKFELRIRKSGRRYMGGEFSLPILSPRSQTRPYTIFSAQIRNVHPGRRTHTMWRGSWNVRLCAMLKCHIWRLQPFRNATLRTPATRPAGRGCNGREGVDDS